MTAMLPSTVPTFIRPLGLLSGEELEASIRAMTLTWVLR